MSLGRAPQLIHEGGDHLERLKGIPQPTEDDVASPEAAQAWSEREILKATPRAVQEVVAQLRYSDSKSRLNAALQILDRGGLKTDNKVTNIAPVIVLTPGAIASIPWAKKMVVQSTAHQSPEHQHTSEVIDGIVITKGNE